MRATGVIRRIDDLGRVVIPKAVRMQVFGTTETAGEPLEIFYDKDKGIILKPYNFSSDRGDNL